MTGRAVLYTWYSLIYTCGREAKHIDMRLQLEHCRRETWARELIQGFCRRWKPTQTLLSINFLKFCLSHSSPTRPLIPGSAGCQNKQKRLTMRSKSHTTVLKIIIILTQTETQANSSSSHTGCHTDAFRAYCALACHGLAGSATPTELHQQQPCVLLCMDRYCNSSTLTS